VPNPEDHVLPWGERPLHTVLILVLVVFGLSLVFVVFGLGLVFVVSEL